MRCRPREHLAAGLGSLKDDLRAKGRRAGGERLLGRLGRCRGGSSSSDRRDGLALADHQEPAGHHPDGGRQNGLVGGDVSGNDAVRADHRPRSHMDRTDDSRPDVDVHVVADRWHPRHARVGSQRHVVEHEAILADGHSTTDPDVPGVDEAEARADAVREDPDVEEEPPGNRGELVHRAKRDAQGRPSKLASPCTESIRRSDPEPDVPIPSPQRAVARGISAQAMKHLPRFSRAHPVIPPSITRT